MAFAKAVRALQTTEHVLVAIGRIAVVVYDSRKIAISEAEGGNIAFVKAIRGSSAFATGLGSYCSARLLPQKAHKTALARYLTPHFACRHHHHRFSSNLALCTAGELFAATEGGLLGDLVGKSSSYYFSVRDATLITENLCSQNSLLN